MLNSTLMIVRLPEEKLQRILSIVREWSGRKACKRRDLESLLGHLQHAATVVRPGRTFVRRLIELLSTVQSRDRWIRLNAAARSDLGWWLHFMEGWNGVSMMPRSSWPSLSLETDASGGWGCGAHWGSQWFQWQWVGPAVEWPISPKFNSLCSGSVGGAVGRAAGRVPLRQYGSGFSCELRSFPGQNLDAPVALPIFHGGALSSPCQGIPYPRGQECCSRCIVTQ